MKNFLEWLGMKFHGHEWEIYKKIPLIVRNYHGSNRAISRSKGCRLMMRCKICRSITYKDIL